MPALTAANKKPVYADCNAISPDTAKEIAAADRAPGRVFIDAGIIGGPPRAGYGGPIFYYSGASDDGIERLNEFGLVFRPVAVLVGAASALKMSDGGITKGAHRQAWPRRRSPPPALVSPRRSMPSGKPAQPDDLFHPLGAGHVRRAYRWVPEMEEDRRFHGRSQPARARYEAIAAL